jgi:hypothetical protein
VNDARIDETEMPCDHRDHRDRAAARVAFNILCERFPNAKIVSVRLTDRKTVVFRTEK